MTAIDIVQAIPATNLDQEEGDSVRPQRPRQLDVFHFGFDLRHLSAVFVLLRVGENMNSADERLLPPCHGGNNLCYKKLKSAAHLEYFLLGSSLLDVLLGEKLLQARGGTKHNNTATALKTNQFF